MMSGDTKQVVFVDCCPWTGGAQLSLLSLVRCVRREGVKPYVLAAAQHPGGVLAQCREMGIACGRLQARHWQKNLRGMWHFLCDRYRIRAVFTAVLTETNPQLIHVNGIRAALLLLGLIPKDIPVIVHDRDIHVPKLARHLIAWQTWHIVSISSCVAEKWLPIIADDRLSIIPNGFDIAGIAQKSPARLPASLRDKKVFVCVGDMVRWKRHDLFLEALSRVFATDSAVGGLILGRTRDSNGRRWLRELEGVSASLGLDGVLEFITDADNALPWIAASDVLVCASDREPFGRVILEALALGKVVVATKGGGPEEILSGNRAGWLVDDTPEAMAAGMAAAMDSTTVSSLSNEALAVAKKYTLQHMSQNVLELYSRLIVEEST